MSKAAAPAVSVAICLLNSSRFIDATLKSVFNQTFDDYEVVLVDDGSTDGCADAIARRYQDPRIRIIRQAHQGLPIARRASIAAAAGEFVAFLDHDDLWLPHKLATQVAAATAHPDAALLFSDCIYVDEEGAPLRRLSDHYGLAGIDLTGTRGYTELLRRGCFVWQSTVLARTAALRAVDGFSPAFPYIADYDTWLRMARRYPLHYTPEVLAHWRVHATQFTQRCPEITLADHRALLGPLYRTASNPPEIRIALGDRLLGQHRVSCRSLLKQKRFRLAARAALGMFSYPDRLRAFCLGCLLERPVLGPRLRRAYRRGRRMLRGGENSRGSAIAASSPDTTHVWIDGSVLDRTQAGYFSLVSELIRSLLGQPSYVVHVVASQAGAAALKGRIGDAGASLHVHEPDWRLRIVDRLGWPAAPGATRIGLWLRRRLMAPAGRPPVPKTVELLVWRGRFRWASSRRIAIVQDLTTRIHPELHPAANVAEFEAYLDYVQRHAETVATVSEHSRSDIIERLPLFPDRVSVIPMPVHPVHRNPSFTRDWVAAHGIAQPFILCVGSIEPRKNLRRLVRAFELLRDNPAASDHILVLAGPDGWDEGFASFLAGSPASAHVRRLGVVPLEHLPSLYHFASAVIYPSVYEGFGLPVLEAMSASAVVAASAVSSLPDVIGDGITFDPYCTEAICHAMLQALEMTAVEAADYRRRCRARADALFKSFGQMPPIP